MRVDETTDQYEDINRHPKNETAVEPMAAKSFLYLDSGATNFTARVHPTTIHADGAIVHLSSTPEKLLLFDADTQVALN